VAQAQQELQQMVQAVVVQV